MPFNINDDGTFTLTGVDHTGATDSATKNTEIIQSAIDSIFNNYGGGYLWLPRPGNYQSNGLIMKGSITLRGHGPRNTLLGSVANNVNQIIFDTSVQQGGLRDLFIAGQQSATSTSNAVTVQDNVPVIIRDCYIWGGSSALYTRGIDGTIENCFILGWGFANIVSNGANWFKRVKADTSGNPVQHGFYQGTPVPVGPPGSVMENHFEQCDFSGNFQKSVSIIDGNTHTAISVFEGCVFNSPIDLSQAMHTSFIGCEFGAGDFNPGNGTLSIVGSVKLGARLSISSGEKAGNVNII